MLLTSPQLKACAVQADLFTLSAEHGIDSAGFIDIFMHGETARRMDLPGGESRSCDPECLLKEIESAVGIPYGGNIWDQATLHWIGYTYRYWHFLKDMPSPDIYEIAGPRLMYDAYPGYHTVDCELAIDWLTDP